MAKLIVNSGDPDQTPRSVASDLGMNYFPITLLGLSRLQWINRISFANFAFNLLICVVSIYLFINLFIYLFIYLFFDSFSKI